MYKYAYKVECKFVIEFIVVMLMLEKIEALKLFSQTHKYIIYYFLDIL